MKVGDLVTVAPSNSGAYMIVDLTARDIHTQALLPDCVMIVAPEYGIVPMHKKHMKVISEA